MCARRRIFAALVLLGYVAVAFGVENVYPFSTFNMYSHERLSTASRLVARDASGVLREVTEFDGWRCDAALTLASVECAGEVPHYTIPYVDRAAIDSIEGPGSAAALDAARGAGSGAPAPGLARPEAARTRDGTPTSAGGTGPVELVRRIWVLATPNGPPATRDCVVHRCEARAR